MSNCKITTGVLKGADVTKIIKTPLTTGSLKGINLDSKEKSIKKTSA